MTDHLGPGGLSIARADELARLAIAFGEAIQGAAPHCVDLYDAHSLNARDRAFVALDDALDELIAALGVEESAERLEEWGKL